MVSRPDHNAHRIFTTLRQSFAGKAVLQLTLLLAGGSTLTALPAGLLFGTLGFVCALAVVAGLAILATWLPPDSLMRFYGAHPIDMGSHAQILGLVTELSQRAQLHRTPHLFVIVSGALSAFSLGSTNRSAIVLTEGVLRNLTMREIAGVLAHEVSHIRNGDLTVFSMADLLTRLTQVLFYLGLALLVYNLHHLITGELRVSWWAVAILVLAPALFNLFQLILSHNREFDTDRNAAILTGDPMGLASAVSRLESSTGQFYQDLFSPVPARHVSQPSLLRCHPPTEQRLARLRKLDVPPQPTLDISEGPRISLIGVGPIEMRPRYRWPGVWF